MTSIHTALRNQTILAWWADTQPGFRLACRAQYATALGCADCELGTMDEFARDADVIDWLATTYANTIAAHQEDAL